MPVDRDEDFDGVIVIFSGAELRMNYPEALDEIIHERVLEAIDKWKQRHGKEAETAT